MLAHLHLPFALRALAAAGCLAAAAPAADPLPPAAKPVAVADVSLARAALLALDADPVLKNVNLIVSVVDRAAVIGGPIASEDVKARAEAVVRRVPGIESVRNACVVQPEPDPLLRAAAARLKPAGPLPPTAVALPGVAPPPAAPVGFIPPVPAAAPTDLVAAKPSDERVAERPPLAPAVGLLGAPVAVAPVKAGAATPGALTGAADLTAAVAAVRKSDVRFARATVEPKPGGALFVSGRVAAPADARDLAERLGKLPGVRLVVIDPQLLK